MTERLPWITRLIVLSILLTGVMGCAPRATQPALRPTPTLPSGWVTRSASGDQGPCGFAINHPSDMDLAANGDSSWIVNTPSTDPNGPYPNFIYISAIPDGVQSDEPATFFNYDPVETQILLNMQVGESRSLRADPTLESWFTYTRLPDTTLGYRAAQAYENSQPWEFPLGTKEIRYYVRANGCTFLVGGYIATVGSGQPGAIGEEMFDQLVGSFRPAP